jgi:hypothetical protein
VSRVRSDRPNDPLTGGQVRIVHARRSAAGLSVDELARNEAEYQVAAVPPPIETVAIRDLSPFGK